MDWKCFYTFILYWCKNTKHQNIFTLCFWYFSPLTAVSWDQTKHYHNVLTFGDFLSLRERLVLLTSIRVTHTHRNTHIHTPRLSTKTFKELWSNKFTVIITQVARQGRIGGKSVSRSLLVLRHVLPHWLRGMMSQCGQAYKKSLSHTGSRAAKTRTLRGRKTALKIITVETFGNISQRARKHLNMCRGLDSLPVTCLERWDSWGFSDIFPFRGNNKNTDALFWTWQLDFNE